MHVLLAALLALAIGGDPAFDTTFTATVTSKNGAVVLDMPETSSVSVPLPREMKNWSCVISPTRKTDTNHVNRTIMCRNSKTPEDLVLSTARCFDDTLDIDVQRLTLSVGDSIAVIQLMCVTRPVPPSQGA